MARKRSQKTEGKALSVFKAHGGILRSSDAIRYGIHPRVLYALRDTGLIELLQKGLYSLSGIPEHTQPDLVLVARKVPRGVICLISSLFFHKLTTQIPHVVYLAVKQGYKPPKIDFPPVHFYWLSAAIFDLGIEVHELNGVLIRCYSKEKTIVDCFRFRNRVGIDVAIEALKKYWQQGRPKLDLIMKFARAGRVAKIIMPYIETIINESS